MPDPGFMYGGTYDDELEALRRAGIIPQTGPRQGGLLQMLSRPVTTGKAAYQAVKEDPVGIAKGVAGGLLDVAKMPGDVAMGRKQMTDARGRILPERIEEAMDLGGLLSSGTLAQGVARGGARSGVVSAGGAQPTRRAADMGGGAVEPKKVKKTKKVKPTSKSRASVTKPERVAYPGIYDRPDEVARKAAERVAPEDPALKQLFGVTRDDLYEMGKGRVGSAEPQLKANMNARGSAHARKVTNPKNTQRMLDTLSEAEKYPGLQRGMDAWYVMDPLYKQFERLYGPDRAYDEFMRFNTFSGMASPGSDVLTEINRGTAANYLHRQGRFGDFQRYGGKSGQGPTDMADVKGHPYHSTSHAGPMGRYIERGDIGDMTTTKVPLYIQSNTNPVSYQSKLPVGDAHFVRGTGLADVRTAKDYGVSIKNPELATIGPWWKEKVADELGITPVQAQARAWGTFGHATGVDTDIGAPKLELLAKRIMEAAKRYDISPEEARDLVLKGGGYASLGGAAVTAPGLLDDGPSREGVY